MRPSTVFFALAALLAPAYAAVTVATPSGVTQCQPTLLTWTVAGSTGPFIVIVQPGGDTSSPPLETITTTQDTSFTWTVDIAAGTSITIAVKDSTGAIFYSAPITVLQGSTTTCAKGNGGASTPLSAVTPSSQVSSSLTTAVVPVSVSGSVTSTASIPIVANGSTTSIPTTVVIPSTTASSVVRPAITSSASTQSGDGFALKAPTVGFGMIAAALALF